ncbi:hypothetical protein ACLOJK_035341 [Asimina triloba]
MGVRAKRRRWLQMAIFLPVLVVVGNDDQSHFRRAENALEKNPVTNPARKKEMIFQLKTWRNIREEENEKWGFSKASGTHLREQEKLRKRMGSQQ